MTKDEAMNENNHITKFNTIEACNSLLSTSTRNSLVSVIDLSKAKLTDKIPNSLGVYSVTLCWDKREDSASKPREEATSTLIFNCPQQMCRHHNLITENTTGYLLLFDVELMKNTLLDNRLWEYPFFSNPQRNSIRLTRSEREMIVNCMQSIACELAHKNDRFSPHILAAGIAVLLNVSMRYYEHENSDNENSAAYKILVRFNTLLGDYVRDRSNTNKEIPTVASCAKKLNLSANYLGDAIRKSSNISAQEYIRRYIINEAKYLLRHSQLNIGEISYALGFKYPHHLTRVFKRETGETPEGYRKRRIRAEDKS